MQSNKCKKLRDKIIENFVNELRESNYYQIDFKSSIRKCLKELEGRKVEQILCYGLGSFSNGVDIASRYQLALLILVYEYLRKKQASSLSSVIEVYDPSFDELDLSTLATFQEPQFKLIDTNEYCGRRIEISSKDKCHLIYMPHLDKYLYNNLLGANWNNQNIRNLLVLGNSFQEMIDSETSLKCQNELYFLNQLVLNFETKQQNKTNPKKIRNKNLNSINKRTNECLESDANNLKALVEISIDDKSFRHSDIFNSLSFQFIRSSWLRNNLEKIEGNQLPNWTCVIASNQLANEEQW